MKNTVPSYRDDKWVVIKPGIDNLSAKDPALRHTRRVAAKIQHVTFTPLLHISSPQNLTKGCTYFKHGKKTKTTSPQIYEEGSKQDSETKDSVKTTMNS